jgi:hypothetical protein
MRLTWSEGWGNFFQGAVKFWLNSNDPSLISSTGDPLSQYVDTVSGQAYLYVDVGDPDNVGGGSPYCYGTCKYSTNEISVANVLWNHVTGTGNYGMQPVWNVISGFKTNPPLTNEPVNLELFYDRWKTNYGEPAASIYTNRLIYYSADGFEPDNVYTDATTTFTVGATQNRRLYSWPSEDADYVKFSASSGTTYTISTSNMLNGADTTMTLLATDGTTTISTNDNANGVTWVAGNGISFCSGPQNYDCASTSTGAWLDAPLNTTTNLASRIVWTATGSGTFYVKVTPSPGRPKSAGKHGSYTLNIMSP